MKNNLLMRTLWFCTVGVMLFTSLPAQENPAPLRFYLIGNSVTDTIRYDGFAELAAAGKHPVVYARQMIPGAPLEWLWTHPNDGFSVAKFGYPTKAFKEFEWDAVSLQPFDRGLESDLTMISNYLGLLKDKSPQVRVYLYGRWPRKDRGEYDAYWKGATDFKGYGYEERELFFDRLLLEARKQHPDFKPFLLVPVGHVMYELNQKMKRGEVPGYTNIFDLYADGIHLKGEGAYLVACTFYATVFRADPSGLPVPKQYGEVDAKLAALIQKTVWEVVSTHPLAGVLDNTNLTVRTLSVPLIMTGKVYVFSLLSNHPVEKPTWAVKSGSLPKGLSLSQEGVLSGTVEQPGNSEVTFEVADASGAKAERKLILIAQANSIPIIKTATLPLAQLGSVYKQKLSVEGGNGQILWKISEGKLPTGLKLTSDGYLSGAPEGVGTYPITISAADADFVPDMATQKLDFTVGEPEKTTLVVRKGASVSASFGHITWDDNALTLTLEGGAGKVTSVEVFLDAPHNGEVVFNKEHRHFIYQEDKLTEKNGRGDGVKAESLVDAPGFGLKLTIPWSHLGVKPKVGKSLGLDVALRSGDGSAITWNKTKVDSPSPADFGNILLGNEQGETH